MASLAVASTGKAAARASVALPTTAVFVCDIQERFRDLIHEMPAVVTTASVLVNAAAILSCPVIVTEQYPKAFKHTVAELATVCGFEDAETGEAFAAAGAGADAPAGAVAGADVAKFEKKLFSMLTPAVLGHIEAKSISTVVLVGIETHICVLQTCLDLLARGTYWPLRLAVPRCRLMLCMMPAASLSVLAAYPRAICILGA